MSNTSNLYSGFGAKSKGGAPVYQVDAPARNRRSQTPTKRPTFTLSGKGNCMGGSSSSTKSQVTGRTAAALFQQSLASGNAVRSGAMDRFHAALPEEKKPKPLR